MGSLPKENSEKRQSGYPVSRPIFETMTSPVQVYGVTVTLACQADTVSTQRSFI